VVLNDNDMSISENVGALSNYFARVLAGRLYQGFREGGKRLLRRIPAAWEFARRSEEHLKGMVLPGTMFEEMGLNYIGPIDGHDVIGLARTLKLIKQARGPQFLHVMTKKGKGYAPAEADPIKWHGPGPFDAAKGEIHKQQPSGPTYTQVFGQWLCDEAERDPRLVAITPAMREGSGLVEYSKRFPNRYYDVGIAEQHAVTLAAGMACEGLKPVVAIYSSFLQRGYDQLIHDVALQDLPVTFALDRAGLVGGDGATHQGMFDLSYLRCIPNLRIMVPADENECRQMLHTALNSGHPAVVRYPRGAGPGAEIVQELSSLPLGKGTVLREGRSGLAILAWGPMVSMLASVAEQLDATLVNLRFVKPLDRELVLDIAARHLQLVTAEENVLRGGAGSAVLETLADADISRPVLRLGIPDEFIEHGSRHDNLCAAGLDVASMQTRIEAFQAQHSQRP
jgi:1-deoxy-D-xylulose-5-phosphate synthase